MDDRPRVRVLGPLRVEAGGAEVEIAQPMRRALLVRLALAGGDRVPAGELADALWADPPPGAAAVIRSHMSRLRGTPLGPHLRGGPGGYAIDAALDLAEAEAEAERASAAAALERWRGAPGAGLPDGPVRAAVEQRAAAARARLLHALAEDVLAGRAADAASGTAIERAAAEAPDDPLLARAAEAVLLAAVRAAGASTTARHHGLPLDADPFVGRGALLAGIRTALGTSRLVTLVGPGGAGKTRTAIEAARAEPGAKEVRLLDLADLRNEPALLRSAAAVVDAADTSAAAIEARLDDGAIGLLVIDNAGHLLPAVVTLVSGVLARCRGIGLLVTSREPLGVPGEHLVPVGPMLGDELEDAVALLRTRLRQAGAPTVADADLRAVAVGLDALPLAIEIAAAQSRLLRPEQLVGAALGARADGSLDRHADLAAVVGWSLDLLTADERDLLGQLAALPGPVTPDAVAAVCSPGGEAVRRTLGALVAKSLVAVVRPAVGPVAVTLLVTIRAATPPSAVVDAAWWGRLRGWVLGRLVELAPRFTDRGARAAGAELDLLDAVVERVLRDAIAAGDRSTAVTVCAVLGQHRFRRGTLREGSAAVLAALAVPGVAPAAAEAAARIALGLMQYQLADLDRAAAVLDEAAAVASDGSDDRAVATAFRAYVGHLRGEPIEALRRWNDELEQAAVSDDARRRVDLPRGQLLRSLGRPDAALRLLEHVGRQGGAAGDDWVQGMAAFIGAKILLEARRPADAARLLLPVARRSAADLEPVTALVALAILAPAATADGFGGLGAELTGTVDALGPRYGFDPAANEPQDFARYRWLVRSALTPAEWRAARARGAARDLPDAIRAAEAAWPTR